MAPEILPYHIYRLQSPHRTDIFPPFITKFFIIHTLLIADEMKVIFDRFPYHQEPIKKKRKDYRSSKHPQSQMGSVWFIRSKTSIIYVYECYEIRSFDLTASDLKLKIHRATKKEQKISKKKK